MIPGFFMKIICVTVTILMLNSWGNTVLDLNTFHMNQTSVQFSNFTNLKH